MCGNVNLIRIIIYTVLLVLLIHRSSLVFVGCLYFVVVVTRKLQVHFCMQVESYMHMFMIICLVVRVKL